VKKVAFVKCDKDTPFEYVADVIDMAHQAGVDHVGRLTPELQQQAELQSGSITHQSCKAYERAGSLVNRVIDF